MDNNCHIPDPDQAFLNVENGGPNLEQKSTIDWEKKIPVTN